MIKLKFCKLLQVISLLLCIFFNYSLKAQNSEDWRDQFVKWSIESKYSKVNFIGLENNKSFNKYSVLISVDVTLDENDVYDSSSLYLQPYFEYSFPYSMNEKISFSNYSAGVHLKKFINAGNQKNNLYFLLGGKIDILQTNTILVKSGKNFGFKSISNDFLFDIGIGYTITDRLELYFLYNKGFIKSYLAEDFSEKYRLNSYSIGLRLGLSKSWWFSNK